MEISSSVALFAAIGTQIVTALGLFGAVTSSFNARINDVEAKLNIKIDGLSREITEVKIEQAKIEGRLNVLDQRLTSLEQTVRYILDCFPRPRVSVQNPQE